MTPPPIEQSTWEARRAYVIDAWKCLHETLYADYIEGKRSYMDVTLELRNKSY